MKHRLIYLATGAAMLFIFSAILKEQVQASFAPFGEVVFAFLIVLGIGIPFAAIALFRVSENPDLLDRLFDLHITRRREKKRYAATYGWMKRKTFSPLKRRPQRHPYFSQLHRRQTNGKYPGRCSTRKRDNSNDYAYPREAQKEIVEKYWEARKRGEVENRDAWASRYNISGRTLRTYEKAYLAEVNGNKT